MTSMQPGVGQGDIINRFSNVNSAVAARAPSTTVTVDEKRGTMAMFNPDEMNEIRKTTEEVRLMNERGYKSYLQGMDQPDMKELRKRSQNLLNAAQQNNSNSNSLPSSYPINGASYYSSNERADTRDFVSARRSNEAAFNWSQPAGDGSSSSVQQLSVYGSDYDNMQIELQQRQQDMQARLSKPIIDADMERKMGFNVEQFR